MSTLSTTNATETFESHHSTPDATYTRSPLLDPADVTAQDLQPGSSGEISPVTAPSSPQIEHPRSLQSKDYSEQQSGHGRQQETSDDGRDATGSGENDSGGDGGREGAPNGTTSPSQADRQSENQEPLLVTMASVEDEEGIDLQTAM